MRGSNCKALTGNILVFWIGGRLWEVVAYERWSLTRGGRTWRFNCIQIEADNTSLNLQNCSYHKKPNPILFENIKLTLKKFVVH